MTIYIKIFFIKISKENNDTIEKVKEKDLVMKYFYITKNILFSSSVLLVILILRLQFLIIGYLRL